VRGGAAAVAALLVALLAAVTVGVHEARDDLHTFGRETAPQAATAADLYYALADMDAQVANVLLIGHDEQVGNKQSALRQLRRDREAVSAGVQALVDRGLKGEGREIVAQLLADLAAYDALTGQARLADDQVPERPVGRPPALAGNFYLSATALMHQDMLPAAERIGALAQSGLSASTRDGGDTADRFAVAVGVLGAAAVVVLVLLQVGLARWFRRVVNPALAAVTLAVAVLTGLATSTLLDHGERMRDAKADAFDPYTALARTRAVASDANADESRYLILPERAGFYRAQFAAKSESLTTASGKPGLAARLAAFRHDDARLVEATARGDREVAVGMATNVGRGNLAFEFFDYQSMLDAEARDHHADFTRRIGAAEDALSGWQMVPPILLGAGVLLVFIGVRPRLREYR
jgi:hypothetical protein